MKGRQELTIQSTQSSTPNLSPPYTLPLFHSTSTYSSPLFSSFAHFRLRNHFLRFFSTGAATFHFPFANIFSFLTVARKCLLYTPVPLVHRRNAKNIFEETCFWASFFLNAANSRN